MAIAGRLGRSIVDTYDYLGDELTLWETEYAISPWGPERGDINAFRVAEAVAPFGRRIEWADFDVTRDQRKPKQDLADAQKQLAAAAMSWPKRK